MNLLQTAKQKNDNLLNAKSVKLSAVKNNEVVVLSESGVIVPIKEIQKFEDSHVWVSGLFAWSFAKTEAFRLNKI